MFHSLLRIGISLFLSTSLCFGQEDPKHVKGEHPEIDKCEYPFQELCKKHDGEKQGFDAKSNSRFLETVKKGLEKFPDKGVPSFIDYLKVLKLPMKELTAAEKVTLTEKLPAMVVENNTGVYAGLGELHMGPGDDPIYAVIRPDELKHCPTERFKLRNFGEKDPDLDWDKLATDLEKFYRGMLERSDIVPLFNRLVVWDDADFKKNRLPSLHLKVAEAYADAANSAFKPKETALKKELIEELIKKFQKTRAKEKWDRASFETACDEATTQYVSNFKLAKSMYSNRFYLSKPVVRLFEEEYLKKEYYEKVDTHFEGIRGEVSTFFKESFAKALVDDKERARIATAIGEVGLKRFAAQPEGAFEAKEGFPFPVLKIDSKDNPYTNPFYAGWMGNFIDNNAFYSKGPHSPKDLDVPEGVYFIPSILRVAAEEPAAFRMLTTHEIGHKVHTELGKNYEEKFPKLFECLTKHLNLKKYQYDEAFADWVAASVSGRYFSKLIADGKKEQAGKEIADYMKYFCDGGKPEAIFPTGSHPYMPLRRLRIFGRDKGIREALGCAPVPHCTLEGEAT